MAHPYDPMDLSDYIFIDHVDAKYSSSSSSSIWNCGSFALK